MAETRERQVEYSEIQSKMFDEEGRRRKGAKMANILSHFLGTNDLSGKRLLDVGSSSGIATSEFARAGATTFGVDIDNGGTRNAQKNFGDVASFLLGDSELLPFRDNEFDLIVCNHIYEHVVDDVKLLAELRRIVKPAGAMYLGLGNRLGIMEPHHKLPFLSWLPHGLADRYAQAAGTGDAYHERFRTWPGLKKLCAGLHVHDYTASAIAHSELLAPGESIPRAVAKSPEAAIRALYPLVPTYLWVATLEPAEPKGPTLRVPPRKLDLTKQR